METLMKTPRTTSKPNFIFDDLLNNFFNNSFSDFNSLHNLNRDYKVNKDENGYELKFPIPGLSKEKSKEVVNINLENNTLNVDINDEENEMIGHKNYNFSIGNDVDKENLEAKVENGLLTINLKFSENQKPKNIEIK